MGLSQQGRFRLGHRADRRCCQRPEAAPMTFRRRSKSLPLAWGGTLQTNGKCPLHTKAGFGVGAVPNHARCARPTSEVPVLELVSQWDGWK